MSQTKSRAQSINQTDLTFLSTPYAEYQFASHLLFKDQRDMRRTEKDCVSLFQRIVDSFGDASVLYCKALISKRMSGVYKRHMLDTVRLSKEINAVSIQRKGAK